MNPPKQTLKNITQSWVSGVNMSITKTTLVLLVLSILLLHDQLEMHGVDAGKTGGVMVGGADETPPPAKGEKIDCKSKCEYRCSEASRQNVCLRACNTCCERCNCVPPGTSGNRDVCPCYANMTTHGGRLKCP